MMPTIGTRLAFTPDQARYLNFDRLGEEMRLGAYDALTITRRPDDSLEVVFAWAGEPEATGLLRLAFDFSETARRDLHQVDPHPTDRDGLASDASVRETVEPLLDQAFERIATAAARQGHDDASAVRS